MITEHDSLLRLKDANGVDEHIIYPVTRKENVEGITDIELQIQENTEALYDMKSQHAEDITNLGNSIANIESQNAQQDMTLAKVKDATETNATDIYHILDGTTTVSRAAVADALTTSLIEVGAPEQTEPSNNLAVGGLFLKNISTT